MPNRRENQNVEFLKLLRDLTDYKTNTKFAEACGKQQSNMHNYLSGKTIPQKKVLLSCLQKLMAPRFIPTPVYEICKIPEKRAEIPELPGVYIICDSGGNALYVGKAKNFRTEVWQTLDRPVPVPIRLGPNLHKKDKPKIRQLASYYSLYKIDDSELRRNLEALLLRAFTNQTHNTNLGHFVY